MRKSLKNVCNLLSDIQGEISVEQSFLNDLKRSIELSDEKQRRLPSKAYHPSSMNCIRNMYYQRVGVKPTDNSSSYVLTGICNSGSDIHERIQQAVIDMQSNSIDCEYVDVAEYVRARNLTHINIVSKQGYETKLYDTNLNTSFLCDGIIKYKNHYYILELKTESIYKWQSRQGVDPSHFNQATAYSISLQLPEVIFVYINRDLLDMKSFLYVPTDSQKRDLKRVIEQCEEYVNTKETPSKPENVPKKACEYCNYKSLCRKEG